MLIDFAKLKKPILADGSDGSGNEDESESEGVSWGSLSRL